jgi:hypothetical protein
MVYPQTVIIGPLQDEVVAGKEVTPDGLTIFKTEPLYRGRVLALFCPFCDLTIRIAADLAPHTLRVYLTYQAEEFVHLQIDRIFDINAGRCTLKEFPLACPRCARLIDRPSADRHCIDCGAAQVQLIRSENIQEP